MLTCTIRKSRCPRHVATAPRRFALDLEHRIDAHDFGADAGAVRVRVGLHTGEAVIGDIGTPKRREFTAIGDTVNAASRLEGVTKDMHCVIAASEATVRAAGEGVKTGKVEEIRVKGKSAALRVHEILGLEEG